MDRCYGTDRENKRVRRPVSLHREPRRVRIRTGGKSRLLHPRAQPTAQWQVEVLLRRYTARDTGQLLRREIRRREVGHHRRAVELGDERLRRPVVPQRVSAVQGRPAQDTARLQPDRSLPHYLHHSCRLERRGGILALREGGVGIVPLGQRSGGGLQRGCPGACRVQYYEVSEERSQHAGRS